MKLGDVMVYNNGESKNDVLGFNFCLTYVVVATEKQNEEFFNRSLRACVLCCNSGSSLYLSGKTFRMTTTSILAMRSLNISKMRNPISGDILKVEVVDLKHPPGVVLHEYTLLVLGKYDRDVADYWNCMILDDYVELVGKIILMSPREITNGSVSAPLVGYEERCTLLLDR